LKGAKMKKVKVFIGILILLLVVMACDIGPLSIDLGGSKEASQPTGGQIEAGVDSPANGVSLPLGPVEIAYHATSTDGVAAIELSVNGEVLSAISSPDSGQKVVALKYSWQPTSGGSHTIRVRAQNSLGDWSDFSATTVTIEAPQQQAEQVNPPSQPEAQPEPEEEAAAPEPSKTPETLSIINIEHNLDKFYYGGGSCGSREITISADVTRPDLAHSATLFTRFYDNEGEGLTKWDAGKGMGRKTDEHFSATMYSGDITNAGVFDYSVLYYQIVVSDKDNNILARSDVIKKLLMDRCP
jgi:hypothetical protein